MSLDERAAVAPGLFVFRCVVTVALFEAVTDRLEDGSILGRSTHYVRNFGVTAESYAAAAAIVEELGGLAPGEAGAVDGWLDGIEFEHVEPVDGAKSKLNIQPVTERGVHFVSARIFYDVDEPEN